MNRGIYPTADSGRTWQTGGMPATDVELVRQAWAAFSRGDVDAAVSTLASQVRWHAFDDEEGGCRDREQATAFIRQTLADGIRVEATDVRPAGGRVLVVVRFWQAAGSEEQPELHGEVVTVRDGKVVEIAVYPNVTDAAKAVGQLWSGSSDGPVPDEMEVSSRSRRPVVELLYFDGCLSHERLLPTVQRLVAEAGAELQVRAVETLEAAEIERFLGSPTLRVNGVDVDPGAGERDDFGLKCRIYRSEEGQSGVPPEAWIRAALDRATA